ncbi:MAG TPA: hypothetical protein VF469_15120 [Kofleriaceae bacterium]
MTRLVIATLLILGGCFQSHPAGQQELMGTDCYACHTSVYVKTTQPVHRDTPAVYSTSCANCHRTIGWQPALEGLHSDVFVIASGKHAQIACLSCHDLSSGQPSMAGANTNCIQCHPDDRAQRDNHADVVSVTNAPYTYQAAVPNFCLSCHPAGTADLHPDNLFRRTGDHNVPCGQCHDRTAGPDTKGANVTCVDSRCHHTLTFSNGIDDHNTTEYTTQRGDGASRNFCHHCHS